MVVLLSGTINSGKTTCARLLARYLEPAAIVEADMFFSCFPGKPAAIVGKDCLRAAAASARRLSEEGYNILFPYPLWKEDFLLFLREVRGASIPIHMITLVPQRALVLGSRSKRKDKEWERSVVNWHEGLGVMRPEYGVVVDSSRQNVRETVREILAHLGSGSSRVDAERILHNASGNIKVAA